MVRDPADPDSADRDPGRAAARTGPVPSLAAGQAEIVADLPLVAQGEDAGPALRAALASKLADVDARIAALQGLRAELASRLAETPETGASCPLRPAA